MAAVRTPLEMTETAVATSLGIDRTRVKAAIGAAGLRPCRVKGRARYFWLHDVFVALVERQQPERAAPGGDERDMLRLRQLRATVAREEMEVCKMAGDLVLVGEQKDAAFREGRRVRDAIMQIPEKVAAELAGEEDAHAIRSRLRGELRMAIEDLAGADD